MPCNAQESYGTDDGSRRGKRRKSLGLRYEILMVVDGVQRARLRAKRRLRLRKSDLDVRVRSTPDQRQTRHPILSVNRLPRVRMFFVGQYTCQGRGLRPGHSSANCAGSDPNLLVVAQAFHLSHIAARHHIKLVGVLPEPDRRRNRRPILPKGGERHVFLVVNCGRDLARHRYLPTFGCVAISAAANGCLVWFIRGSRLIAPSLLC
jgi:hypothetical protein